MILQFNFGLALLDDGAWRLGEGAVLFLYICFADAWCTVGGGEILIVSRGLRLRAGWYSK